MAWQPPGHNYLSHSDHPSNPIDFSAALSLISGDTGQFTTEWRFEEDAIAAFANGQNPTSGDWHSALNNATPADGHLPPRPVDQAKIAGFLTGVGGAFGSQPTEDATYASLGALSVAIEGGQRQRRHRRRRRSQAPTTDKWEDHKVAIHDFYMKKNYTLLATIEKMKTHHQFFATEKMYKLKFKKWNWNKNLKKTIVSETLSGNQESPKVDFFGRRVKDNMHLALNSSGATDNERTLVGSRGTDNASADPAEGLCRLLDEGPCRLDLTSEVHSRVQEAVRTIDEDTCNHEKAELALIDALSCYSHHLSPIHRKTRDVGYSLASFYIKRKQINAANCLLDWMTKKHGDTDFCNSKIVAHVLRTISFLRGTRRDEEADWVTYQLLKHHQAPEAPHFFLQNSSGHCIVSDQMIQDLLARSKPDRLVTMFDNLKALSEDPNNHTSLQNLLCQYIEKCDQDLLCEDIQKCDQLKLEQLVIRSGCILANILAERDYYEEAIPVVAKSEELLMDQPPLEPSTIELTKCVAFTFLEVNDLAACFRVLGSVLENMNITEFNDTRSKYSISVCEFLISTASEFHNKCECVQSRAWMNQVYSRFKFLFEDNHELTMQIKGTMVGCDLDRLAPSLFKMKLDD